MLLTTLLSRALARRTNVTASDTRAGADWLRHVAALSTDALLAEVGTRASGLAEDEVAQMRAFWVTCKRAFWVCSWCFCLFVKWPLF